MLLAAHCELVWKYLHIGDIFALFILFAKICVIVIAACSVSLNLFLPTTDTSAREEEFIRKVSEARLYNHTGSGSLSPSRAR